MKWNGYSEKAVDRANKSYIKAINSRSIWVTLGVTALIVLATASAKWTG